jgi:hypothetical protein
VGRSVDHDQPGHPHHLAGSVGDPHSVTPVGHVRAKERVDGGAMLVRPLGRQRAGKLAVERDPQVHERRDVGGRRAANRERGWLGHRGMVPCPGPRRRPGRGYTRRR